MPDTTTDRNAHDQELTSPRGLPQSTLRVLRLLFELAQADEPAHVGALAARLGHSGARVAEQLLQLERAGLAQAERARLTMGGLVVASRLPAVARPEPGSGPRAAAPRRKARPPRQLPAGFLALPYVGPGKESQGRA